MKTVKFYYQKEMSMPHMYLCLSPVFRTLLHSLLIPLRCVVKIIGEMVLSFPAGITRHFANNPSPAVLTFSITNYSRLEHVLPNPQLLCW